MRVKTTIVLCITSLAAGFEKLHAGRQLQQLIADGVSVGTQPGNVECALIYCNANGDLKDIICGGSSCTTDAHAAACRDHWTTQGEWEDRKPSYQKCADSDNSDWTLVVSQKMPNLFSKEETDFGTPNDDKYSALSAIRDYERSDGVFTFKLSYPNEGVEYIWQQTTNPALGTAIEAFQPVSGILKGDGIFGGLGRCRHDYALMDNNDHGMIMADGECSHVVGGFEEWGENGIPAADSSNVFGTDATTKFVQLYVMETGYTSLTRRPVQMQCENSEGRVANRHGALIDTVSASTPCECSSKCDRIFKCVAWTYVMNDVDKWNEKRGDCKLHGSKGAQTFVPPECWNGPGNWRKTRFPEHTTEADCVGAGKYWDGIHANFISANKEVARLGNPKKAACRKVRAADNSGWDLDCSAQVQVEEDNRDWVLIASQKMPALFNFGEANFGTPNDEKYSALAKIADYETEEKCQAVLSGGSKSSLKCKQEHDNEVDCKADSENCAWRGNFVFKLSYPNEDVNYIWRQTSNPSLTGEISGFEPLSGILPGDNAHVDYGSGFRGLGLSGPVNCPGIMRLEDCEANGFNPNGSKIDGERRRLWQHGASYALLDGNGSEHGNWFHAVGTFRHYQKAFIPAVRGHDAIFPDGKTEFMQFFVANPNPTTDGQESGPKDEQTAESSDSTTSEGEQASEPKNEANSGGEGVGSATPAVTRGEFWCHGNAEKLGTWNIRNKSRDAAEKECNDACEADPLCKATTMFTQRANKMLCIHRTGCADRRTGQFHAKLSEVVTTVWNQRRRMGLMERLTRETEDSY